MSSQMDVHRLNEIPRSFAPLNKASAAVRAAGGVGPDVGTHHRGIHLIMI